MMENRDLGLKAYVWVLPCFLALDAMCGIGFDLTAFMVWGLIAGSFDLALLILSLAWFNPQLRMQLGYVGIARIIGKGFFLMIPFSLLAAFAQFALNWHAAQAFLSSGLMSSGALIGGEMVKAGGGRLLNSLFSMLWSVFSALTWMLLSAELSKI